ncbi:(Fe-S)-binding protein [Halobacillus salinarum]|uniref:Glycolate oxidase iron-sulfur subunit n=1 Tax=Halobacillus salinarum TaxID=2932257 RepID=A0ABY4EJ29_9BACI|nr:(Fe-S)-binding protein [Halobacillus salinarum]UOQ44467.1 (Fe-S)-binding protein [Halobacillus salinarum]
MSNLEALQTKIQYEKTFDCVQCGYCLPACPTYETMERETHSPRGRINLVKMVAEGKASIDDLKDPIEKCLGCMACTTVCPTNVQYGAILEGAKEVIEENEVKSPSQEKVEQFIFNTFFPSSNWMGALSNAAWFYKKSGTQRLARITSASRMAPLNLDKFERVLPEVPSPVERLTRKRHVLPDYKLTTKVAFFTGCVMDGMFFKTNANTIELLRRSGAEVVLPKDQTCCGALHAHSGKGTSAKELAKRNIEAFDIEDVDYIVNNAGGCGAKMIEYEKLFEEGTSWYERAKEFTSKVRDISEVLVELNALDFTTPVNRMVTYQPSCHMSNVQRVTEPPRILLESIPGLGIKELKQPDFCCGSAGIYNIVNYEDSMEILDVKMQDVLGVNPEAVVTTNPGCLIQMKLGIEREQLEDQVEAMHLVDLLMEAKPVSKRG